MKPNTLHDQIAQFLSGSPHAVAGASTNRSKYGNKVLRCYMQNGRDVIPVNPHEEVIEGLKAVKSLEEIGRPVHGISIITPPPVTAGIVKSALAIGIRHFWMQPGAEDPKSIDEAEKAGANVIWGGACILVIMGYRENA